MPGASMKKLSKKYMCRYLETLRVEQGTIAHAAYHNHRLNNTRKALWQATDTWQVESLVPSELPRERHKLRIVYDARGVVEITLEPYTPKPIGSLQLVTDNHIFYAYKAADRKDLQQLHALRGLCDDVLIVKNGLLTDTTFANVAFFDGRQWLTPQQPLLKGTARARLLQSGILTEAQLTPEHLSGFSRVRLINAMLHWGECEFSAQAVMK